MRCPQCGYDKAAVVDCRPSGLTTRRRRRCSACDHRFTTYEIMARDLPENVESLSESMTGLKKALGGTRVHSRRER